jgi:hypothetical protein
VAKNSDFVKDYDKMSKHKELMDESAPGAPDPHHMPSAPSSMGAKAAPNKSTEPGPHKYRFSTTTPVTQAQIVPGAALKSIRLQEGENMGTMSKIAPPGGDKEDREDEEN